MLSLNAQDIYGCTSPFAPNYNPAATINDYSCDYDVPQLLADGYCIQELLDGDVWYYDFQGIEYGGGYIRHVSPSAGKALISSGTNVGSFEWGCYGQSVSTSTAAWTGETNTLAIVSAGCTDVADAAIAAYQFSQNGYSMIGFCRLSGDDWSQEIVAPCGAWYSLLGQAALNHSLNLARARPLPSGSLDYRFNSNHVVPVRYIDLEDDCIGPASCQDWVQEGQGGPPPGVSCDYPLFNCESVDDPIWNDMATGLYPADTSYLEVGISSDASVLLHASETFTVDGTAQTLISLEIDSIADLPPGLTLDDPGLPLMLSPDEGAVSTSCFALEGVPSDQGTYTITVYSTATIAVFGFEIPVDGVQFHHTIEVLETTSEILGCTYADALNFNPYANSDDGSCEFEPFAGCESDADGDGVCDQWEVCGCQDPFACNYDATATDEGMCDYSSCYGCTDAVACNYDAAAAEEDGSCVFCGCEGGSDDSSSPYTLTVEAHAADIIPGQTTYRVYQNMVNEDDFLSSVYGNNDVPFSLSTTTGFYNSQFGGTTAGDINPAFLPFFPDLSGDSWVTIGIESQAVAPQASISVIESYTQPWVGAFAFGDALSGQDVVMTDFTGGAWYVLNGTPNGFSDENGRVLIMQITTAGELSGVVNTQIFGNGLGENDVRNTYTFSGSGEFTADGDGGTGSSNACGCTDAEAFNYDPAAQYDDGSCIDIANGCTDDAACNYNADATDDEGSCTYANTGYDCDGNCLADADGDAVCDEFEVAGCTESNACNYDSSATDSDDSCAFATTGYDCDGNCLLDTDGDDICDQDEVTGCQAVSACNYDETATDSGYCDYPDANYDCSGNCLNDADEDGICDEFEVEGCTDCEACNFSTDATDDDGSCGYAAAGFDCDGNCLIDSDGDGICDQNEILGCTDPNAEAFSFQPLATEDDGSCIYCNVEIQLDVVMGDYNESGNGYAGVSIIYGYPPFTYYWFGPPGFESNDEDIFGLSSGNYLLQVIDNLGCEAYLSLDILDFGCDDLDACNYNPAVSGGGSCDYPETNYDCYGNCLNDSDEDGVCDEFEIAGCTNSSACNYSSEATDDTGECSFPEFGYTCDGGCLLDSDADGICDQDEIIGCQIEVACNYDPAATEEGYCDFAESNYDCNGNCLNDANEDGICDEIELQFSDIILEAVDDALETFIASVADGIYCGEGTIWVEEWSTCIAIPNCFGDLDSDGNRGTEDLLLFLAVYNTQCPMEFGCMDSGAINYNPTADYDDGSCEFGGCTITSACNFDPIANFDDGTCLEWDECGVCGGEGILENTCDCEGNGPSIGYDCSGNCLSDTNNDGVCDENEILGCMSSSASNFNSDATSDDGSCLWDSSLFIGLSYDLVSADGILGQMTVRVFADFEVGEEVVLTSIFGNSQSPWITASAGEFYQHPLGADFGGDIIPGFFSTFPELEFDSWFTIGAAPGDYNALSQQNMYVHLPEFNAGDDMIINTEEGAAIYAPPASGSQGYTDENGRVLIGQFTTNGLVQLVLNITFQDYNLNTSESLTNLHLDIPFVD